VSTHRAQQIVDAVVATLQNDTSLGWHVYRERLSSLDASALELPAVSVTFGADKPLSPLGATVLLFLDSLLELNVAVMDQKGTETELVASLMAMRTRVHADLMLDRTQGLPFVIDTRYGGVDPINATGSALTQFSGEIVCHWPVYYRMNIADPST
jgi:hypothetical protein